MASTFTSKLGSLTHCTSALEQLQLPLVNVVLPPSPSIPPGSLFPTVMQTLLKVLPQPSPHSCISLLGTPPPPRQPTQHILGATAAQSFPGKEPTASSGSKTGTATHIWQEGESLRVTTTQLHPLPPSAVCKLGQGSTACCIEHSLPPALAFSHPLPAGLYSAGFLRSNVPTFPLSGFICFSKEGGVSCSSPQKQPLPSYHFTQTHPPLPGKCYLVFWRVHFQRQEMAKNEPYTLPRGGSHKAGLGLPHHFTFKEPAASIWLQQSGAEEGRVRQFLPLTQDYNYSTAHIAPPPCKSFSALLPNEVNKPNPSH